VFSLFRTLIAPLSLKSSKGQSNNKEGYAIKGRGARSKLSGQFLFLVAGVYATVVFCLSAYSGKGRIEEYSFKNNLGMQIIVAVTRR